MKRIVCCLLVVAFSVVAFSCTTMEGVGGAIIGGVVGAGAGALLDRKNPFRGAIYGGALGATAGGLLTEMSTKATREASRKRKPVGYRSKDGKQAVLAEYVGEGQETNCDKIRSRKWENGELISDNIDEVCKGKKITAEY